MPFNIEDTIINPITVRFNKTNVSRQRRFVYLNNSYPNFPTFYGISQFNESFSNVPHEEKMVPKMF